MLGWLQVGLAEMQTAVEQTGGLRVQAQLLMLAVGTDSHADSIWKCL